MALSGVIADCHFRSLQLLTDALRSDYDGLSSAARAARRMRYIDDATAKKLVRLDVASHVARHLTTARAGSFVGGLETQLAAASCLPVSPPSPGGSVDWFHIGDSADVASQTDATLLNTAVFTNLGDAVKYERAASSWATASARPASPRATDSTSTSTSGASASTSASAEEFGKAKVLDEEFGKAEAFRKAEEFGKAEECGKAEELGKYEESGKASMVGLRCRFSQSFELPSFDFLSGVTPGDLGTVIEHESDSSIFVDWGHTRRFVAMEQIEVLGRIA